MILFLRCRPWRALAAGAGVALLSACQSFGIFGPRAVRVDDARFAVVDGIPQLTWRFTADWMTGFVNLRCPESLMSIGGFHYLDHDIESLPTISSPGRSPRNYRGLVGSSHWYTYRTREGLMLQAIVRPVDDGALVRLLVRNETDTAQELVTPQFCLTLSNSQDFGDQGALERTFVCIDGRFRPLSQTTPDPASKSTRPWIHVLLDGSPVDLRKRAGQHPWWVADQVASHPLIMRVSADHEHLVAIGFLHATNLCSNSAIPCLHSDVSLGVTIRPRQTHEWRGRLFLMDYDPARLLQEFESFCKDS